MVIGRAGKGAERKDGRGRGAGAGAGAGAGEHQGKSTHE